MTQDEIIRMARDTGKTKWFGTHPDGTNDFLGVEFDEERLLRFATLVAAYEREKLTAELINEAQMEVQKAVLAERKACAKVCEQLVTDGVFPVTKNGEIWHYDCAAAIRARSN